MPTRRVIVEARGALLSVLERRKENSTSVVRSRRVEGGHRVTGGVERNPGSTLEKAEQKPNHTSLRVLGAVDIKKDGRAGAR